METLGIDLGTSGVRAVVLGAHGPVASEQEAVPASFRRDPAALWATLAAVLGRLPLQHVAALAVAGTSGTLLATTPDGDAVSGLSLYADAAEDGDVAAVAALAPADSPARGHSSALARSLALARMPRAARVMHEADWIAGRLCGVFGFSDENNALKTGYDPAARQWPRWIAGLGLDPVLLPQVLIPGQPIARAGVASGFGLRPDAVVAAGTTDGCASFLAAGAGAPGDAVTVLGSTLTVKLLSRGPISAPALGVYSHRLWDNWLAGGASNTGGAVLAAHFSPAEIEALSSRIDPSQDSGCRYYPLPRPGERFPVNDPAMLPLLTPRPADDAAFLHGLLEGIARIEALGYRRLVELGAPAPVRVSTLGGGAGNAAWTAIRSRLLGVPVVQAHGASAAHGAALLARRALASQWTDAPSAPFA